MIKEEKLTEKQAEAFHNLLLSLNSEQIELLRVYEKARREWINEILK